MHTHNEILPATKKEQTLPSVATWMDLESIMPREINQTKKNTI